MNVVDDCFVGQFRLLHRRDQFFCGSVLDVGQLHIADMRSHPLDSGVVTCRWLDPSTLATMEHAAIFNRLDPKLGWQYEVKLDGYCTIATKSHGNVSLFTRQGHHAERNYPGIQGSQRRS
jgi:hypothetical protein